jgi:hypothetical protein
MRFDVFGMCNAIYDIQAEVSDELLAGLGLEKGSMRLLEERERYQPGRHRRARGAVPHGPGRAWGQGEPRGRGGADRRLPDPDHP